MLVRLHIHKLDIGEKRTQHIISSPREALQNVPSAKSDPSLQPLVTGYREGQPIAAYLLLQLSDFGHCIPVILEDGVSALELLINYGQYREVILCLQHILPLFIKTPDDLLNHEK